MDSRAATNKVLPKWGLTEVHQQMCFYQPLCYICTDGFQIPHFGNTQPLVAILATQTETDSVNNKN